MKRLVGAAFMIAVFVGACSRDKSTILTTTTPPTTIAVTTTAANPADVAACSGRVKAVVAGYGRIDTLSFAAKMSGDQVAAWKHFQAAPTPGDIGSPNVTPQALGLDPNETVELCVFDGLFTNAAIPGPALPGGADLGPVTQIGVLVKSDATVLISYMHPAAAGAVASPKNHL